VRASAGGLRLAFFHRGHCIDARGAERGQNSKEQAAQQGDGNREGEDAAVHFEIEKNLTLLCGNKTNEQRAPPSREEQAENRADTRKHDAFGEDLANEADA
jgi:hypothetical protein